VKVELLRQRIPLVSHTIRHDPLHGRRKHHAPTIRSTYVVLGYLRWG